MSVNSDVFIRAIVQDGIWSTDFQGENDINWGARYKQVIFTFLLRIRCPLPALNRSRYIEVQQRVKLVGGELKVPVISRCPLYRGAR